MDTNNNKTRPTDNVGFGKPDILLSSLTLLAWRVYRCSFIYGDSLHKYPIYNENDWSQFFLGNRYFVTWIILRTYKFSSWNVRIYRAPACDEDTLQYRLWIKYVQLYIHAQLENAFVKNYATTSTWLHILVWVCVRASECTHSACIFFWN